MRESSKAIRRRWVEDAQGVFPWRSVFIGNGLDVGCGDDKLPFDDCKPFDKADGNAEKLDEIIPLESLDYLHGSQSLEHMADAADALARWFRCVKKGGYLIASVPDFDAYEKRCWPSKFNGDHKWAFSLWRKGALNCKNFIHVPTLLAPYNVKLCRLVLTNFDFQKPDDVDQTREESEGVECWVEWVIQK